MKLSIKPIIKCILINDDRNNNKSIFFKPILHQFLY